MFNNSKLKNTKNKKNKRIPDEITIIFVNEYE